MANHLLINYDTLYNLVSFKVWVSDVELYNGRAMFVSRKQRCFDASLAAAMHSIGLIIAQIVKRLP